eukprot:Transcript_7344.p4 GENE.Transcript_7344~~Transcript_7344.p4  ORF type:complete len:153 (-),score=64.53 Transcript_7344:78-536(-)
MLRLPSLDEHLAAALRRLARGALQETVLLLLSDHGTHGIWYSNEFELGAAEHKLPLLFVVAPDWLLRRNPRWADALAANQRRLVTVRDIYQTMRTLVAWPDPPPDAAAPSLLEPMPEERTCADAGIPDVYCACRNRVVPRRFPAVVDARGDG